MFASLEDIVISLTGTVSFNDNLFNIIKEHSNLTPEESMGVCLYIIAFYSGCEGYISLPELCDILNVLKKNDIAYFKKLEYKDIINQFINFIDDKITLDVFTSTNNIKTIVCNKEQFIKSLKSIFLL